MKTGLVNGFDVSHHNGAINFSQMFELGHRFCFAKASEGATVVDQMFAKNASDAALAGLRVGAYHFFRPQVDPKLQAEHFLNVKGSLTDLPCTLDFEVLDGVSIGAAKANALIWLDIVEKATGKKPFFYSYRSFLQELGDLSAFASYPLWLAVYSSKVLWPKAPDAWPNGATFWQYSDANGLDFDVLNAKMSLDSF